MHVGCKAYALCAMESGSRLLPQMLIDASRLDERYIRPLICISARACFATPTLNALLQCTVGPPISFIAEEVVHCAHIIDEKDIHNSHAEQKVSDI